VSDVLAWARLDAPMLTWRHGRVPMNVTSFGACALGRRLLARALGDSRPEARQWVRDILWFMLTLGRGELLILPD